MSIPLRHHYLPEWFQRRWAGPDGKVFRFTRPHQDVVVKAIFPVQTGYEEQLYAVPTRSDAAERQALESQFMSPVDSRAAEALATLEGDGNVKLDATLASDWSRFVLSLMHRTPERVEFLKRRIRAGSVGDTEALEAAYQKLRTEGSPPSVAAFREEADESLYEELVAGLLRRMIDSPAIGGHLNNMRWSFGQILEPEFGLLLGDSPVMTSNGLGHPDSFIIVPTGPSRFFMAVNAAATAQSFIAQDDPRRLERAFNDAIVRQAASLVIGANAAALPFVNERLGRNEGERTPGHLERMTWKAPL